MHNSHEAPSLGSFSTLSFFLHGFKKHKDHNMLVLMLILGFKNLQSVTNYIDCENTYALVVQYDLLPLLTQCYKTLMPFVFDEEVHVQSLDFHCGDLFQTTKISANVLTSLMAHELDSFCHYNHVHVDNCKCALFWWHGEEHKFQ